MSRERFTHDESLRQLRELAADDTLRERVSELFVAGVATGMRRAMTPVMSFYAARHVPAHDWADFDHAAHNRRYDEDEVPCAICGLKRQDDLNREAYVTDFGLGRCAMAPSHTHLIDLQDVPNIQLVCLPAHGRVLRQLLQTVDEAPPGLSASKLEKHVSAAKVMPGSNLASRLWCLRILAELGVITNAVAPGYSCALRFTSFLQRMALEEAAFAHMPSHSDPVWPLSAKRGLPAVDWALARQIFPQLSD